MFLFRMLNCFFSKSFNFFYCDRLLFSFFLEFKRFLRTGVSHESSRFTEIRKYFSEYTIASTIGKEAPFWMCFNININWSCGQFFQPKFLYPSTPWVKITIVFLYGIICSRMTQITRKFTSQFFEFLVLMGISSK